ncbi:19222_t:CDS:2, partial [Gigaspora margarita]
ADWEEVVDAFKKRFCTICWQNQWLRKLDNLKQQIGEPDEQVLYYFKKGLRPEILSVLMLHNPTSLKDMLKYAQIHEQGMDFANDTMPNQSTTSKNYKKEIEQLTKQMQQISLNYATIASALVTQTEKNLPQYKLVKRSDKEKGQDKNINLVIVESSEEEEVYIMRPQPYTKDRKGAKSKQKQSESCREEALRKKAEIQEQEEKPEGNIMNQKAISDIGWEDSINDEPHEIYIKLDDLVSQHEATLEKEVKENDIDENIIDRLTGFIKELPTRREMAKENCH